MPPENDTPADDLRSLISQSFDQSTAAADPAVADTKPVADAGAKSDPVDDTASTKDGDRARGPDGKFAKKEGEGDGKTEAKADDKAKTDDKEPKVEAKKEGDD